METAAAAWPAVASTTVSLPPCNSLKIKWVIKLHFSFAPGFILGGGGREKIFSVVSNEEHFLVGEKGDAASRAQTRMKDPPCTVSAWHTWRFGCYRSLEAKLSIPFASWTVLSKPRMFRVQAPSRVAVLSSSLSSWCVMKWQRSSMSVPSVHTSSQRETPVSSLCSLLVVHLFLLHATHTVGFVTSHFVSPADHTPSENAWECLLMPFKNNGQRQAQYEQHLLSFPSDADFPTAFII